MGKPKKSLKGFSNGHLSQYGHTVDINLSEGLGNSGRVDQGIRLSDVSCIPKKRVNKDKGYGDCVDVPSEVLMLSRMSKAERKNTKIKLIRELEEVRRWRLKLASLNVDVVDLSPSSVCSVGKKRPPSQGVFQEQPAGKKSDTRGRNGSSLLKRDPPVLSAPVKKNVAVGPSTASLMKLCNSLLSQLMSHKFGGPFNTPVDAVKLNIPDYHTIIKHPMDFSTIKDKIATGQYSSPLGFAADVRLTLVNSMTYNPIGNRFHAMAKTLSSFFEKKWKPIEKKIPSDALLQPLGDTHMHNSLGDQGQTLLTKSLPPADSKLRPEPGIYIMTAKDKQKLNEELESVLPELPITIIEFLKDNSSSANQDDNDEIEIDIDALSDDTLIKLRKLLDEFLTEKKNANSNLAPSTTKDSNEIVLDNPLVQLCKGNEADEDIDICGNDSPVLRFSPVQIENVANPNNSSSESDSSSSDSDSGSSSDSESEGKATTCLTSLREVRDDQISVCKQMETQDSGASTSDCPNGQVEHSIIGQKPPSDLEGENAPSVRQLSPEKVYRAALLKSRFADTILKAQEKVCEKDAKLDSEKLREVLEKRRKQEKARLQAEAEAAEEARKKAVTHAAAEAKKMRESEREAARLALEKMEKTVDINEGCVLMEDLEVLTSSICAGFDDLSGGLVEDGSPDYSENVVGSLKLERKSNVLEQLGLYMKADVEEDEDDVGGAPESTLDHVNDV